MNVKHLNNNELASFVSGGLYCSRDDLVDLVYLLVERLEQSTVDNQEVVDDISNNFDEFESAYATVSHDINKDITIEYHDELKSLKETIQEYL